MKLQEMGRAGLFSLVIAPIVATSFSFADSQYSVFLGFAIILLIAGLILSRQRARSRSKYRYPVAEPKPAGEKLSNQLVALSSAAIIAVYSAGYFRTNAAAHQFAEQSAHNTAGPTATGGSLQTAGSDAEGTSPGFSNGSNAQQSGGVPPPSSPASAANTDTAASRLSASNLSGTAGTAPTAGNPSTKPAHHANAPDTPPSATSYRDGTYVGRGSCPHGDIQVEVLVASGLIVSVGVTRCETRYPCSLIDKVADDVVYQQGNVVDMVTGATESAYAFHEAVAQALSQALVSHSK